MVRLPGCCSENYDPQTSACQICGFTYDPAAWAAECHRRAHTPRTRQAADALPSQFLFPYHRDTAGYCTPACRGRAARARGRTAKACGYCGAASQAPYCNDHYRWQAAKSDRLMRLGGRPER